MLLHWIYICSKAAKLRICRMVDNKGGIYICSKATKLRICRMVVMWKWYWRLQTDGCFFSDSVFATHTQF